MEINMMGPEPEIDPTVLLQDAREENLKLRRMLALATSNHLYGDDGELSDSSVEPFIDFKRDAPDKIKAALMERSIKKLREQEADDEAGTPTGEKMQRKLDAYANELGRAYTISLDALIESHRFQREKLRAVESEGKKTFDEMCERGRQMGMEMVKHGEYIAVEKLRYMTIEEVVGHMMMQGVDGGRVPRDVVIDYTNWEGKRSYRRIKPTGMTYGTTDWHPEPQHLLHARDLDKHADRQFALKDIHNWNGPIDFFKKWIDS